MTLSIIGVDETPQSMNRLPANFSKFALVDTYIVRDAKGADTGREALYQRTDTDAQYPVTVRIGAYPGKSPSSRNNISVRYDTWVKVAVTDQPDVYEQAHATLATSMPRTLVPDTDDFVALIQNLLSWFLPTVVAGDPMTAVVTALRYGLVNTTPVGSGA